MKTRKPLRRKRPLARSRSSLSSGQTRKHGGKIKPRNAKRRASEFKRWYGSKERVAWVRALPCVWCLSREGSDNAHTENGGKGRKADYQTIAPLCRPCHTYYDQHKGVFAHDKPREFVRQGARETARIWLASSGRADSTETP